MGEVHQDVYNLQFKYEANIKELAEAREKIVALQGDIDKLKAVLSDTTSETQSLNAELEKMRSLRKLIDQMNPTGDANFTGRLKEMGATLDKAANEFRTKMDALNLGNLTGENKGKIDSYFEAIRSGAMTVDQAVSAVKANMSSLISDSYSKSGGLFDAQMVQQFTASLTNLETVVMGLSSQIKSLSEDGMKVASVASTSTDNGLSSVLQQIQAASAGASGEAKNAYESLTQLITAIQQYGNIDAEKLSAISRSFGNLATIGEGSFGEKKANSIISLITKLQEVSNKGGAIVSVGVTGLETIKDSTESLKSLANFLTKLESVKPSKFKALNDVKLENFNNINVQKEPLSYLAKYLPIIANVSAAKLKKLQEVDLSNFNNVVVNKSSIEAISRLTEALKVLNEAKAANVTKSKDTTTVGVDEAAINRLSTYSATLKEINTINASITSGYKSISSILTKDSGSNNAQSAAELESLRTKYIELQTAIEQFKLSQATATQEDVNNIHALQVETQNIIATIQGRIDKEKEAAAAALRASKENAANAQQEAKEKEAAARREEHVAKEAAKQKVADEKAKQAAVKQYYTTLTQIEAAIKNYTAAENSQKDESKQAYAALVSQRDALRQLNGEVASGSVKTDTLKAATSKANETLKSSTATIKANGDATKTWSERVGNLGAKFGTWFSITRIIMYVVRAIRQMISASVELDSAMAQMQIVTKASESQMNQFADSAAKAAQRIGSSITDFISSATTFARLGYSLDESSQLAEFTAMLQNVGDIDVSSAQDAITSIVKAFDVDTDEIESVMDKLVTTGNNFPISVSQIAEGMTNASSALAAAGNSFEQSVALLTAANTTINLCRAA